MGSWKNAVKAESKTLACRHIHDLVMCVHKCTFQWAGLYDLQIVCDVRRERPALTAPHMDIGPIGISLGRRALHTHFERRVENLNPLLSFMQMNNAVLSLQCVCFAHYSGMLEVHGVPSHSDMLTEGTIAIFKHVPPPPSQLIIYLHFSLQ